MKEEFIKQSLLKTNREGIEDLIAYMEDEGFFEAACSGKYHLAEKGGLAEHTKNVMELSEKLGVALYGGAKFNEIKDSVTIAAALHDLGKMGQFGKPNYIPDGKAFKTNPDLLYVPHEVRSVAIAQMFIDLTEEEQLAILYHNGLYGSFKKEVCGNETPLYMLIHFADMWASRVTEIK